DHRTPHARTVNHQARILQLRSLQSLLDPVDNFRVGLTQVALEIPEPVFLEKRVRTPPGIPRIPVLLDNREAREIVDAPQVDPNEKAVHAALRYFGSSSSVKAACMSANRKTLSIASVNEQKYSDS